MSKFVAIDFETANGYRDSVCSVGIVEFNKKNITKSEHFYIKPSKYYNGDSNYGKDPFFDYDFKNTDIHGISWNDVSDAGEFEHVWSKIKNTIDSADFVIAHNYSFEKGAINACCDYFNIKRPNINWLCSMKIARDLWNIRPTRLSDVCKHHNIDLTHHDALSDAEASAKILIKAFSDGIKIS